MFKKIKLNNGVPLLMEASEGVRSICIGIWIKVGSRYETSAKNGISHFLEHMFFKGTASRSAEGIAMEIDSLGGELNAMTSSEYTLFYIKVLDEYLKNALDLLTDILLNSEFPEEGMEKEKGVISEEINMVEDNPSDYIHDIFSKNIWGEEGLGQPVIGKREIIENFSRQDLVDHVNNFYGTDNIIVACSGNFKEEELVDNLNQSIGSLKRDGIEKSTIIPGFRSNINIVTKDLSEAHVCLGLNGIPYTNKDRYTMHLLNTILGGGFSSRLFQNIREKRGMAYSIYSYHASYIDTGIWAVYAGTDKKHVNEVVNVSVDEIKKLPATVTDEELSRAKAQLKGNLILALESTSSKMTNIAKQEIYYGRYFTPEDIISMVDAITLDHVKDLANDLIVNKGFALTVYGPVKESDLQLDF